MEKFLLNNFIYIIKKQYIDFKGSADRKQFWSFAAVSIVLYLLIPSLIFIISLIADRGDFASKLSNYICAAVLLPPLLSIISRRLRDSGHSVYWQLFFYVPCIVCGISFLLLLDKASKTADFEKLLDNTAASIFAFSTVISAVIAVAAAVVLMIFLLSPSKTKKTKSV